MQGDEMTWEWANYVLESLKQAQLTPPQRHTVASAVLGRLAVDAGVSREDMVTAAGIAHDAAQAVGLTVGVEPGIS